MSTKATFSGQTNIRNEAQPPTPTLPGPGRYPRCAGCGEFTDSGHHGRACPVAKR
jgi:hypothetical protein